MDPAPFAQRRVGTTLRGKWTLEKLIGEGGMAAVYVGVHRIGQRAAIKILHPDVARSKELCARFEQEAHAVNRFVHPGVVAIRDVDVTEDGAPFLVMELLEGDSLADLASRPGGVETAEVVRLVDALLDVLVAAHAQGIVHRDIKPDNLFVTRDGRLKVLDFGIARVKDGMKELRTRAGAMLGTAPYMSPEQIRGVDIDARVDIFAVGATMFRLLARRRIHEASSEPELLVKMATQPAPPLLSVAPSVPPEVARIVDRALAYDRDARYPDAASMQRDIRALLPASAPSPAPEPVTAVEAPPPAVRVVVPVAVAAVPVVAAVSVAEAPTVLVPALVAAPVPGIDRQRREETKTALIFLLGLSLLVVLALVVVLLARPAVVTDTAAPIPSGAPSADDPDRPPYPSEGVTPPRDPGPPGWQHRGKGKGKGHGKGKHREDD